MSQELRSGLSLWRALGPPPISCSILGGTIKCEAVVIGAGITGTLVGYMLSKAGLDTVLVDKESIGTGSTAASTGLLQYEVDSPLIELINNIGETKAVRAYRRGLEAVDEIESITQELSADCGFTRRPTLCLASREADCGRLREEYECRRHFGFDVSFWKHSHLSEFGIRAPAALFSLGDGEVDPYLLTQSLAKRSLEHGIRAFEKVKIEKLLATAYGVELTASEGSRIEARAAVIATGYSAKPFLSDDLATLHTTYALASEPLGALPKWPERCLIWETARPYFYGRQTHDGRVILGGEDTPFADDHQESRLLEAKAARLEARFSELFPGYSIKAECRWAGTFAETKDGLPFIGKRSKGDSVYFALGYGGNGITFSVIAAGLLRDLILGRPNADAGIFGFNR